MPYRKPHLGHDNAEQDKVAWLRTIGNRVADAAKAKWSADVRNRKLTIANGAGKVHGKQYNLAELGITLNDDQSRKPLGVNAIASPPLNQAGLHYELSGCVRVGWRHGIEPLIMPRLLT